MSQANAEIRFLHISDTHFGPTKDFSIFGKVPFNDFEKISTRINQLKFDYDFIIHTGDVISYQSEEAYKIAAERLSVLKSPRYFVTGNHDDPILLKKFELFGDKTDLVTDNDDLSYYFNIGEYICIVLDVKHSDHEVPSGVLRDKTYLAFKDLLESTTKDFLLFLHFPIHKIGALWVDTNLRVEGGDKIHKECVKYRNRSRGVFYGHIHQPTINTVDGIQYISTASTSFQLGGWPNDVEIISHEERTPPGFSYVSVTNTGTFVRFIAV